MTEKFEHLSVDEATEKLSALYTKQLQMIKDKKKGVIVTLFNLATHTFSSDLINLRNTVLAENGIPEVAEDKLSRRDALLKIVAATEARGSKAAQGIKLYDEFTKMCNETAEKTQGFAEMSPLKKVYIRMEIAKQM